jgi:hypothetical protein
VTTSRLQQGQKILSHICQMRTDPCVVQVGPFPREVWRYSRSFHTQPPYVSAPARSCHHSVVPILIPSPCQVGRECFMSDRASKALAEASHRSNWTTFPTPGWHYACSESGYTDSKISLEWLKRVFDPQTRGQANQKPQVLICDGFGTHETLEGLEFCFENHIVLCRLPSHTSHKLQPCDVGVFAPLKVASRWTLLVAVRAHGHTNFRVLTPKPPHLHPNNYPNNVLSRFESTWRE